jgi:FSR family fosmidomycin resistance protein-like MFS transporter
LSLLAVGHAVTDTYGQSLLAPIYPLLAVNLKLTLEQIGFLSAIMGLSASLGQPLWGYLSDRWPRIPMIALGPAIAALGCTTVGLAPGYSELATCLFLTGIGIGVFHPQAAALAKQAGRGRGLAMAAFTVGGNLGFGAAPLLGAFYLQTLGLRHLYVAAIPGLLVALALAVGFRFQRPGERHAAARASAGGAPADRRALAFLTATVVLRSGVQIGMTVFLPFLVAARFPGMDQRAASGMVVSSFLLASAFSGPVGGHLTDRLGRKRVMTWSFALASWPLLLAFQLPGYWFLAALALGGFILMLPHPANVVMAQEFMPRSAGIAASMITGFAWGLAQILATPLGAAAGRFGVQPALMALSLAPLLGVFLVAPLPERRQG